jgi:hypothetical protein
MITKETFDFEMGKVQGNIRELVRRVRRLEGASGCGMCEKVEEDITLPPRASWGDDKQDGTPDGTFIWNEEEKSLELKVSEPVIQTGRGFPPFPLSSLPATSNPSRWGVTPVVGGVVFSHPEIAALKLYDSTTGELTSLPTTDRDARLVDRSRR